jgi:hypothetical protein
MGDLGSVHLALGQLEDALVLFTGAVDLLHELHGHGDSVDVAQVHGVGRVPH